MAKGSQNGVLKGKRGNTVFYRIANSNNKEKQGSREYVADVANPMTVPQATQRVKMTPAIRFYSAFKEDCLNHSFEGVKYGGQSMRFFMKKAFELQSGWPFARKGLSVALPGEYLMSSGSLTSIQYEFDDSNEFCCEVLALTHGTLGEWAESVIEASHGSIQNGDQITILTIEGTNIVAPWTKTVRVVLDTTATDDAETALNALGIYISPDGIIGTGSGNDIIYGGCVIVSRPETSQTTGALSWKRSTQRMAVNYGIQAVSSLFTQSAYATAVRSFTKSGNRDIQSDYYLNQGKKNAADLNIPDAPVPSGYETIIEAKYRVSDIMDDFEDWPTSNGSFPDGNDSSTLYIKISSEDELNLDLAKIRNTSTDTYLDVTKVINDNVIEFTMPFSRVMTGDRIAIFYDGLKKTSNMEIEYIDVP